jgi:hypothetical protein
MPTREIVDHLCDVRLIVRECVVARRHLVRALCCSNSYEAQSSEPDGPLRWPSQSVGSQDKVRRLLQASRDAVTLADHAHDLETLRLRSRHFHALEATWRPDHLLDGAVICLNDSLRPFDVRCST